MKTEKSMKTFFKTLGCIASLICVMSCDGPLRNAGPDDQTGGGNRNRFVPDVYTLTNASGKFYGNYYNDATSNLYLTLYNDDIALILDLIMDEIDEPGIVLGKYSCGLAMTGGMFYPGHHETDEYGDYVDGSSVTMKSGSAFTVDSGTVLISELAGDRYSIKADVKAGNKDYSFVYEGKIVITDERQEDPGDGPGASDETWFPGSDKYPTTANAVYNGKWDKDASTDYYTLAFVCGNYNSDGNFVDKGYELVFDILTEDSDGETLIPGTYDCTHNDCTPHHFLDGIEEDGVVYPSYFYRQYGSGINDYSLELVTDGSLTIESSEKGYKITAGFKTVSGTFAMAYDGEISFTKPKSTSSLSTKASVCAPRSTAVARPAKASKPRRISEIR